MPYIITTTSAYAHPSKSGTIVPHTTRTAVGTLDEARQTALETVVSDRDYEDIRDVDVHAAHILDESGGTIGPLPDGTVIEVAQVSWLKLRNLTERTPGESLGSDSQETRMNVLAAFNEAQAVQA